jgi:hypothetical protein
MVWTSEVAARCAGRETRTSTTQSAAAVVPQIDHHTLEAYLHAYLEDTGIGDEPKGQLFRTVRRGTRQLSATPLPQANAYAMVRRRALAAGIGTAIGNHTFRATGITTYLKNGGTLKNAAAMEPRIDPYHPAVRPATRRDQPGRGGADPSVRRPLQNSGYRTAHAQRCMDGSQ